MEQSDLLVRRIKDGTVIDHINEGKGLNVLEALEIDGSSGNVITIALNMPSGKLKKKDMIKVEGRFLEGDDTNRLAVIAPSSTVNIIKDYKLVEKRRVSLPNQIEDIFRCSNPDCITNSQEHIESIMEVMDKDNLVLKCRYCGRILDVNDLVSKKN
ncbi:MAG: aspartate carbamoyltransferase regulatory subunit [Candidatus Nitrosopelagicus brevis]|nr:aspartate carbamoyltransferase regulatory subunit [Candidatus Nitrosopelagicus brevis]